MASDYIDAPIEHVVAVAKSDTVNQPTWLERHPRGIILDADGTVKITDLSGEDVSLTLAGKVWHPQRLKRVWSTGTDADLVIMLGW